MSEEEMRGKMFLAVKDYVEMFGFKDDDEERRLANSEALFQSDGMQIDALNLVGDLLDILNSES